MVGTTHLLGIVLALAATIAIACTNLFVRKGTDHGDVSDAVFVIISLEVVLLTPPVLIVYYPDYRLTLVSLLSFVSAGIAGTLVGQAFHYASIDRIGASRTAPIVASWALISTILGVIILNETVSALHGLGVILITGGVGIIAWETSSENPYDLSQQELLVGLLIPIAAAVAYGLEPVLAKVGFAEGTPALIGVVVKTIGAFVGFVGYLLWRNSLPDRSLLRTDGVMWFFLAGVTTTVFVASYYISLELAPVSIVAPIVPINILFVIVLSALFMSQRLEQVTKTVVAASIVVVLGIVVVTIHG